MVEDEPVQRLNLIDIVEDGGFEALDVPDAARAVALLETRSDVRLLLTDVDMPGGMDGVQLAAAVRDRWPPIEIVLLSARVAPDPASLPARSVFMSKPVDSAKLLQTLQHLAENVAQPIVK